MKKYDQIHESVVRDVFNIADTLMSVSNEELSDFIARHKKGNSIKSIARASNDLICVFPVLSSRNIDVANQALFSKAIEKNCVSMLQLLFSANQLSDATTAKEYISQFHTNLNKSSKLIDVDDIISIGDALAINDSAIQVGGKVDMAVINAIKEDMKNINYVLGDEIANRPISEGFRCNLDPNGEYIVEVSTINEAKNNPWGSPSDIEVDAHYQKMPMVTTWDQAKDELDMKMKADYYEKRSKEFKDSLARKDYAKHVENRKANADMLKNRAEFFNKQVLDTQYKKANELQPTLMVINFKVKSGDEYTDVDSIIIGVKAKLIPISSEDIITHLVSEAKDSNWVQKFIQAGTREISFFKDFLFAIDKAKIDALSMSRKGSANKMWRVLKRRATKSKFNRLMARSNDATAITTLMISQNEVDFIKKEYFIDITDTRNTKVIMDGYNFLGFIVVDESLEIGKFMWDTGDDEWETLSFNSLEKEGNDTTYKKIVNLMTKVI